MEYVITCLFGLFLGGLLGGLAVYLYQGIREGRIDAPDTLALGPLKLELSSIAGTEGEEGGPRDPESTARMLQSAGPPAAGCLSLAGSFLVLVGFILPWFTCNISSLIQGSFSGLTVLFQLIVFFILSLVGASGYDDFGGIGAVAILILLPVIFFIGLIPVTGFYVGRNGLRLFQTLRGTLEEQSKLGQAITRMAVIGLVPMLCYLATAVANFDFSALGLLGYGISVQSAGTGLWVTFAGFVFSIAAGVVISIYVSLAQQSVSPTAVEAVEEPGLSISSQEREVLYLTAQGLSTMDIADRLGISAVHAATIQEEVRKKLGVEDNEAMVTSARDQGIIPFE
jgi:DNA-binding CsgD family transcriptional regulator